MARLLLRPLPPMLRGRQRVLPPLYLFRRRHTRMFRNILAAAVCTALLAAPAAAAEKKIQLKVAGNLLATGLILKEKEQPFFEKLAETTGLPIEVDYKPMDVTGIKDVEGLRVLKSGLFDIV